MPIEKDFDTLQTINGARLAFVFHFRSLLVGEISGYCSRRVSAIRTSASAVCWLNYRNRVAGKCETVKNTQVENVMRYATFFKENVFPASLNQISLKFAARCHYSQNL